MAIATTNPTTGETLKTFEPLTDEALEEKLAQAAAAARSCRRTTPQQRAGWLRSAADVLDADTDAVAELMTTEMGKTLASAKAEVAKCATALRWYAENGPALLEPQRYDADAVKATEGLRPVHQPLGVVLAVMPWNFPLCRRCASPHRRSWPATSGCSSTRATCRRRRCTWRSSSSRRASPTTSSRPC